MIKLIKSSFYKETRTKTRLIDFISKAKILSIGAECRKFEKAFAKKQQRSYAVFVNSGSSANLILIQTLLNLGKLKQGDKIGFSALTWPTNVMPIIQLGLVPVAIDCNINTLNVGPDELKKHIHDIKGLFLTNVLGFSDSIKAVKKMCSAKGVILIEDNCESLGSKTNGVLLGNFGIASTFSFYVGHHLSTIEGGMVCTDDEKLYVSLVMARAHGWDRNLEESRQKVLRKLNKCDNFYARYTFYDLAYNTRPTEIAGFIGNTQLRFWDEIVAKREKNFKLFQKQIENNNEFIPLKLRYMNLISNFAMPLVCKNSEIKNKYQKRFKNAGVEIRPIIAGDMTRQPFYKKYVRGIKKCKNAYFIHQNGFYFANNPELTQKELKSLCSLLEK